MKKILFVLIPLLVLCACSGSKADQDGEVTLFQEIRYANKGALSPEAESTVVTVDDWRQITMIKQTGFPAEDTGEVICSGVSLLDEIDYEDLVKAVENADLINYQPDNHEDTDCGAVPGASSFSLSYFRNDGKSNTFDTFPGCVSDEIKELTAFINALALEAIACDTNELVADETSPDNIPQ